MVDRYTKIVLTVIAVMLAGHLVRPLFEARPVDAQPPACGTAAVPCVVSIAGDPPACGTEAAPCLVSIVGGPPGGGWQGGPVFVFDAQAETRARQQLPPCGAPGAPCHAMIVGGPEGLGTWQGAPLIFIEAQRIVPRTRP